jgi:hypothetical protein
MQIVIEIDEDRYDEIMSMDWKNCRLIFGEEIRAIHDGKVLEQEQCADMVSRDAMWEVLQRLYGTEGELVEELMSLPPVLPMPKMGRWIKDKCSICGEERAWYGQNPPYCPDCGSYNGGEG